MWIPSPYQIPQISSEPMTDCNQNFESNFSLIEFWCEPKRKFLTRNHNLGSPKCLEPVTMIYSHFRAISLAKSENLSDKPSNCLDQSHDSVLPIKHPFDLASCPPGPMRTPNPNPKKGSDCNESVFV